jgi:peptidoglycan glycosyltransferase
VVALFALLFLNLNWVQFVNSDYYKDSAYNRRTTLEEYSRERGLILAGNQTLAKSVKTKDGELKYQREYPQKDPYAHLTGFMSLTFGSTGIEKAENDILNGEAPMLFTDRVGEMFTGDEVSGGNVVLSIKPKLQEQAWKALTDYSNNQSVTPGAPEAAVMLDPATGHVLAQVSTPSYDPNPMASHDNNEVAKTWKDLNADGAGNPALDRATQDSFPPGSTMKVLVAAAALKAGLTPDTMIDAGNSYNPPQGGDIEITNSDGQCPEKQLTMKEALARSCNTAFAKLCVDNFQGKVDDGAEAMKEITDDFGFGDDSLTTPLTVAPSTLGNVDAKSYLARACFGQQEVKETPMMDAMISATIANDGDQMTPNLIKELQYSDETTADTPAPDSRATPIDSNVASQLREMMEEVVNGEHGTGKKAQIPGVTVGGKTGTAEHGEGAPEHGWFTGYAMDDNGNPKVAVSVLLTDAGEHGSGDATQIAGDLMKTYLGK